MRHTAPAGQRPNRRRNPAAAATAPVQDHRYRRTPTRRQPAAIAIPAAVSTMPVEAVWPDWIIPGAMGSVMLMISVYHHAALADAVLRLF